MRYLLMLASVLLFVGCGDTDDDTGVTQDDAAAADGGQAFLGDGGTAVGDGGGDDYVSGVDCEILDPVSCKKEPSCRVLSAFAVVSVGDGEYCVENHDKVDVGCTYADAQCTYVTSWGAEPSATDQCFIFGDCQPEGWGHCAEATMRTTNPC